jgi:hypothetical protein
MTNPINDALREARRRGSFTLDAFTGELLDAPPDVIEQPDPARKADWDSGVRPGPPPPPRSMNDVIRRDVARQRGF